MDENRTYGIEIELHSRIERSELARRIERAFRDAGINHHCATAGYRHDTDQTNFHYWYVQSDSSITRSSNSAITHSHGVGAEVVSPILKGQSGLKALEIVCSVIDNDDFRVSTTCGLHVHHGVTLSEKIWQFINSWIDCEKHFLKIVPPSRQNNHYSRPWAVHFRDTRWDRSSSSEMPYATAQTNISAWTSSNLESRYASVNMKSISLRNTIEFRMHSGTTEFKKIKNWIIITQSFLNVSLNVHIKSSSFQRLMEKLKSYSSMSPSTNTDLTADSGLFNVDAKKQKLPRDGSKLRLIADMLIEGARKDQVVRALNDKFGRKTKSHRTQVTCKIADFQTLKYGYGWKIEKASSGKYKVATNGNNPAPEPVPNGEVDTDLERACEWMHERYELFAT